MVFFFLEESYTEFSIFCSFHTFKYYNWYLQTWRDEKTHSDMKQVHSIYRALTLTVTTAHGVCGPSACHSTALIVLQHCLLWFSALSVPSSTPTCWKFLHILIKMRSIFSASLKVSLFWHCHPNAHIRLTNTEQKCTGYL